MLSLLTLTIFFNVSVPYGTHVYWYDMPSHLGWFREWSENHPVSMAVPIQDLDDSINAAWIVMKTNETAALEFVKFNKLYQLGDYLNLVFSWYGPQWSLGIAFGVV